MAAIKPQGCLKAIKKESRLQKKSRRVYFIIRLALSLVLFVIFAVVIMILSPLFFNVTSKLALALVAVLMGAAIVAVDSFINSDEFELRVGKKLISRASSKEATRRRERLQSSKEIT